MAKKKKQTRPAELANESAARPGRWFDGARGEWLAAAILVAAIWLVYGRAIDAPFIFDDTNSVDTNDSIRRLWPLVGTAEERGPLNPGEFSTTSGRPVVNLSLAINYYFGEMNPRGYHILNIAVHCLSTLLVAAIVRRTLELPFFGDRFTNATGPLAFVTALLWALHPLQTEAVIYITQRTELFMGFFYLATLYASLRYWSSAGDGNRAAWLATAVAACAAGMGSKEVMVSAPVMVLLFERTFVTGSLQESFRRSWPLYAGLAGTWGVLLYLNIHGPRSDSVGFHLGVPAYAWWSTQAKILLMYLKLVVWPWPLVIHYEMPYLESPLSAAPYVLPVAVLAIGTLWLLWRGSAIGYVGTWVFAILSPTLLVPINTEVAAERRMYLPLAAIAALVVAGGYQWAALRWLRPRTARTTASGNAPLTAVMTAALVVAVVFCLVDARRLAAYNAPLDLWQQAVDYNPENSVAQLNLGVELAKFDRHAEAIERYEESLRIKPDVMTGHNNLGLAAMKLGRHDLAIAQFRALVRLDPSSAAMRNNLGVALDSAGQTDEAIVEFKKALAMDPKLWRAHDNLGKAYKDLQQFPAAVEQFEQAVTLKPDELGLYARLADACVRAKQPAKAMEAAEQALSVAKAIGNLNAARLIETQLEAFRASQAGAAAPQPADVPTDGRSSL